MGCQQSLPTDVISSGDFPSSKSPVGSSSERAVGSMGPTATPKALNSNRKEPTSVSPPASTVSGRTARTEYSSSTVSLGVDEDVCYLLPKVDYNGHLLTEEIVRRTSSSIQSSVLSIGKGTKQFELQYAYRSQRGYNPQEPLKPNQEKHGITLNFASEGGDAMIGLYSGHGEKGKQCSNLCQTILPQQLAKFIRQKRVERYSKQLKAEGKMKHGAWNPKMWPLLSTSEYEHCCKRAFRETKKLLQQEKEIKDNMSGTSAVTVCFHGGCMYVSSLGGCSAILGRRDTSGCMEFDGEEEKCEIDVMPDTSRRIAVPLGADHTLSCQKELERIKLAGAEVKHSDENEFTNVMYDSSTPENNENQNPLRIYVPGKSFPGMRFTRSICDGALDEIGISSDPSIFSCDPTSNDDVLIIGSPGVFQFLTYQEVMNVCSQHHDPLQASEAITRAAYEKWIEHTNRCDDITVIVCFLSNFCEPLQKVNISSDLHVMVDDYDSE